MLLANSLTMNCGVGLVYEVESFVEYYLEASNLGRFTKTNSIERSFVYFISDVISTLLNEYDFKSFFHFISDNVAFLKLSHFKFAHQLKHELVEIFVIKRVVGEFQIPSLAVSIFLFISHSFGIVMNFLIVKLLFDEHLKAGYFRNF